MSLIYDENHNLRYTHNTVIKEVINAENSDGEVVLRVLDKKQ